MVGWCGGECDGVFHQQLSISAHPPIPRVVEEQSSVYQSLCFVGTSASLLVFRCSANSGHCTRHWERGMALGMMLLHSNEACCFEEVDKSTLGVRHFREHF